jgi:hypothetical protein
MSDVVAEVKAALAESDREGTMFWYLAREDVPKIAALVERVEQAEKTLADYNDCWACDGRGYSTDANGEGVAVCPDCEGEGLSLTAKYRKRAEIAEINAAAWELTAAGNREDAERLTAALEQAEARQQERVQTYAAAYIEDAKQSLTELQVYFQDRLKTAEASYQEAQLIIAGLEAERDHYEQLAGVRVSKRALHDAINRRCSCGGRRADDPACCPACHIWHDLGLTL